MCLGINETDITYGNYIDMVQTAHSSHSERNCLHCFTDGKTLLTFGVCYFCTIQFVFDIWHIVFSYYTISI